MGLPAVYKFQTFSQGPLILFDKISNYDSAGPGFATNRMYKTALTLLDCLFDEVEDGIESIIFFIKNLLFIYVYISLFFGPPDREIVDTKILP